jgi:hypothetical protein
MRRLQEAQPGAATWSDIGFIKNGTEEAIASRAVLKWTYPLAFALADGDAQKELFTFLQQDLESRTERLSFLLEKDAAALQQTEVRAEILSLTGVCLAARRKLLNGAPKAEGFAVVPAGAASAAGEGAA